jgi:nicotinamidase/pyrazinamidase
VEYDSKTALLVVDVQNDFADPGGSLYVDGGDAVLPVVNAEIAKAKEAGAYIIYTQDWHPPSTPHFHKYGGVWPVHCIRDSWGSEFHPDLDVVDGPVVRKGTDGKDGYSAFSVRDPQSQETSDTVLETLLLGLGIKKVVIAGLATDYCVKETALDAIERNFETYVLKDAISAVNLEPDDGERALETISKAGAHIE